MALTQPDIPLDFIQVASVLDVLCTLCGWLNDILYDYSRNLKRNPRGDDECGGSRSCGPIL